MKPPVWDLGMGYTTYFCSDFLDGLLFFAFISTLTCCYHLYILPKIHHEYVEVWHVGVTYLM